MNLICTRRNVTLKRSATRRSRNPGLDVVRWLLTQFVWADGGSICAFHVAFWSWAFHVTCIQSPLGGRHTVNTLSYIIAAQLLSRKSRSWLQPWNVWHLGSSSFLPLPTHDLKVSKDQFPGPPRCACLLESTVAVPVVFNCVLGLLLSRMPTKRAHRP